MATPRSKPLAHGRAVLAAAAAVVAVMAAALPTAAGGAPQAAVEEEPASPSLDEDLVEELSSETASVYREPDGNYRMEAYAAPVNYLEDGHWQAIDNELVPTPGDTFAAENAANDYTLKLPEDAGSTPVKLASDDGRSLTFAMDGLDGAPVLDGTTATYTDVADAAEVVYEAVHDGVKESIVIDSAPAGPVEYVFDLRLSTGLRPILRPSGAVDIVDASARRVFVVPAPFMVDGTSPDPVVSTDVTYQLRETAVGWELVVIPSIQWLQDAARVYPVVVDPTITETSPITDGWISEGNPTSPNLGGNHLRVGGGPGERRRALVKFSLSQLPAGAVVESATLKLYLDASQTSGSGEGEFLAHRIVYNQPWGSGMTWNNRMTDTPWSTPGGEWAASGLDGTLLTGATSGYKTFDVTPMVSSWTAGRANNGFIVRKLNDGTDRVLWFHSNNSDSTKMPKLEIVFSDAFTDQSEDVFNATFAAMLDCMKRNGEVPASATISSTFGTFQTNGEVIAPAAGVSAVSPTCVAGASDLLDQELTGVAEEDVLATYAAIPGRIQSGAISTTNGIYPSADASLPEPTDPLLRAADEVDGVVEKPTDYNDCHPTSSSFLNYLNFYSDISLSSWKWNSNNELPCRFRWDDDGCSHVPDSGPWFDFKYACKRHDFGYRNLHRAEDWYDFDAYRKRNKNVADEQFKRDMYSDCTPRSYLSEQACKGTADRYYYAVSVYDINTLGYGSPWTYIR